MALPQLLGLCQGYVSPEEYRKQVVGTLEFEEATTYRDLYNSVKQVFQKQLIPACNILGARSRGTFFRFFLR